ncbi:MAG: TIGR03013 family PEP-CTERM/XrtA system glycosyltransferase [Deltaproteobacteria bacterium]|nr:TIGR03013 family PEP-CTERM/XrtA system glycosyltransferase [Candidatus Tharpellaceae bacterium]
MRQFSLRTITFFLIELSLFVAGGLLSVYSGIYWLGSDSYDLQLFVSHIISFAVFYHFSLFYFDLYDIKTRVPFSVYSLRLVQATGLQCLFLAFFSYVLPGIVFPSPYTYFILLADFLLIFGWRVFYDWLTRHDRFNELIMLVGDSSVAGKICECIFSRKNSGYQIVGIMGESEEGRNGCAGCKLLSPDYSQLYSIALAENVNRIIVSMGQRRGLFPAAELLRCKMAGIIVMEDVDFYEQLEGKILVDNLRPSWLIFTPGFRKPQQTRMFKRSIGMILAGAALILAAPVMMLVALAVKIDSPGPVFFVQERLGEDEKPFPLFKFRSMRTDAEKDGPVWAKEEDDRVTRVGNFIRKTRLDEIPQLINIFKGDMSFVGPRPERKYFVDQLKKEIPFYDQRFSVKPGVTGWAQVRFPYGASVEDAKEKLQYELYYIKYLSPVFDLLIILETIKVVLFGRGSR